MLSKITISVSILFVGFTRSAAADRWSHFLPQENVSWVEYDRITHTYWFGTVNNGLWRFDGENFEHLDLPQIRNQRVGEVTALAIDEANDELWVGTLRGLFRYYIKSGTWDHFDSRSGLAADWITALLVGADGTVWYGSQFHNRSGGGRGVGRLTASGWANCPIPGTDNRRNFVDSIAQDKEGDLYLGTRGAGLYIVDSTCISWTHINTLPNQFIQAIASDRNGDVWVGTRGGVCKLDKANNLDAKCFTQSDSGLVGEIICAIWIEAFGDGDIKWFGTNLGVSMLDSTETWWKTFTNANSGLGADEVRDIVGDNDGNLWFTFIGPKSTGVSKFNNNWSELKIEDGLTSNFVLAVEKDPIGRLWAGPFVVDGRFGGVLVLQHGNWQRVQPLPLLSCTPQVSDFFLEGNDMWVATNGCGILRVPALDTTDIISPTDIIRMNDPIGFPSNNVSAIVVRSDTLWAGTDRGLVRMLVSATDAILDSTFNVEKTPIPSDSVFALSYGLPPGSLWIGTSRGLTIFNGKTWTENKVAQLPQNTVINAMARGLDGAMWVGTNFGIARFDGSSWQPFTIIDGLPDERISSILAAPDGEIWCGTLNGAASYLNGRWTAYTTDDGLSNNFIFDIVSDKSNVIWFATRGGGISRYRKTGVAPNTFFVDVFDVVTAPNVTFRYSGFDVNTPTLNLRYEYALDDTSFWNLTSNNNVTLHVEKDGPHDFFIRAIDKDGNVDDSEAMLRFTKISPQQGGAVEVEEPDRVQKYGSLWLYIPPNSIQEGKSITVTAIDSASIGAANDEELRFTGIAYELSPPDLLDRDKKNKPITLKIFYRDQIAQDFDERKLRVYRLDLDNDNTWTPVGGSLDKDTTAITTTIDTLGTYALFEDQRDFEIPDGRLKIVAAQPRIFSPNGRNFLGKVTISFDLGEPAEVTAKVYNLAGRLVQVLCEKHPMNPGRNVVEWNGQDRTNSICPSGLYIVTVQASGQLATKTVMINNQ